MIIRADGGAWNRVMGRLEVHRGLFRVKERATADDADMQERDPLLPDILVLQRLWFGPHIHLSIQGTLTPFVSIPHPHLPYARLCSKSANTPLTGSSVWPGRHHTHLSPVSHSKDSTSTSSTPHALYQVLDVRLQLHDSTSHSARAKQKHSKSTNKIQSRHSPQTSPPTSPTCSLLSFFRRWR